MTKDDVKLELDELAKLGVKIPQKAYKILEETDLSEYDNMSVSEVADLIRDLSY